MPPARQLARLALVALAGFTVSTLATPLPGQTTPAPAPSAANRPRRLQGRLEKLEDPYRPAPGIATAPGARPGIGTATSVQVNVTAGGANILGDAANEPSLAVDPTHPDRMAIGWRQFDTVSSNFRQAGWGYSQDGGRTWHFAGILQPGIFRSDPVLGFDAQGAFYYASLTQDGSQLPCSVFKSTNGGVS